MKSSKDVFDLFRESQSALEEQPSKRTWRRIERKLELRDQRSHRFGTRRRATLGSAMLLTLAFTGILAVYVQQQIIARHPNAVFTVEQLQTLEIDPATGNLLEYSRNYPTGTIHVPEGQPGQELIVRP